MANMLLAVDVPAPHGHLEGLLQVHEAPFAAVVVCHPHPQLGGNLHNPVTFRMARELHQAGATVLRFNFRGVGASTGAYGNAIDEEQDVIAAFDLLAQRYPGVPLWVAGYSFGARVGLSAGVNDPRVEALLGVGLALSMFDMSFLADRRKPVSLIQGERDEYGGAREVRALFKKMMPPTELHLVPEAGHSFAGQFDQLEPRLQLAIGYLREVPLRASVD